MSLNSDSGNLPEIQDTMEGLDAAVVADAYEVHSALARLEVRNPLLRRNDYWQRLRNVAWNDFMRGMEALS